MNKINFWVFILLIMFPTLVFALPEQPTNLEVDTDSFKMTVTWDANTNPDDDGFDDTTGYYISYWVVDVENPVWRVDISGVTEDSYEITGLNVNTTYKVELAAYSGSGDTVSVPISDTGTTRDIDVNVAITGTDQVAVSIDADGSGIELYDAAISTTTDDGSTADVDEFLPAVASQANIDEDESHKFSGLSSETYYVRITVGGEVLYEKPFSFEATHTFFSDNSDKIEDGCFIQSSTGKNNLTLLCSFALIFVCFLFIVRSKHRKIIPFLTLMIIVGATESRADDDISYQNIFGIKGGWFEASESDQRDVYEQITPFSIFYERMFNKYLSADIDLGYSKSDGAALAVSSGSTELVTELEMYPSVISVNINYDFSSFVTGYFGVGGDWWLVEEKSALGEFKNEVGGWHAKTGVKIFSDELETFKQLGCLFEASYTQLDKFGTNDFDLGGWKFNFGLMYCM